MTIASCRWISKIALASMIAAAASASASPVVYTLRTVADGKLGSYVFAEALVTIQMKANTLTVQKQPSSNGGYLYTNSVGTVTVSVTDASGRTRVATFAPGEVYARYDSGMGIAGFGSALGPSYPVALDCDDVPYPSNATYVQDCLQSDWAGNSNEFNGTLSALADPGLAAFREVLSPELAALPQNLSQSTLLTGQAHSCATTYTVSPTTLGFFITGDLLVCAGPASRGLNTDHGGFLLQDQVGGSMTPPNPFGWGGWGASNTGSLQVEVMTEDRED
jgi:hypothetical protein